MLIITITFCVNALPASSANHLLVGQRVNDLPVEHYRPDDDPPSREVHPRGESGGGLQDLDESLSESPLNDIPLVKCQTYSKSNR